MEDGSSIFGLQIQQMLAKLRPNYEKRIAKLDTALRKLKEIIESLPEKGPLSINEIEDEVGSDGVLQIPFPEPRPRSDARYTFSYARPSNINVVGSFAIKTAIQTDNTLSVDLAVTMPSSIFSDKDFLDYRYFHKRAFYLAQIARGIKKAAGDSLTLHYLLQHDNHLQPVIIIKSSKIDREFSLAESKCQIVLMLAAEQDLFPVARLLSDKCCIRLKSNGNLVADEERIPTPFYNSTLRSEMCTRGYLSLLQSASSQSAGFIESCMLGSVWLRQRGFGSSFSRGGFGAFEWACVTALLLKGVGSEDQAQFPKGLNNQQLFRAVLQFLATKDLQPSGADFTGVAAAANYRGPSLLDKARQLNILFKVTPWSYEILKQEARRTLRLLNDPHTKQFEHCFILKIDNPLLRYDCQITIPVETLQRVSSDNIDSHDFVSRQCFRLFQTFRKGFGDRANLLNLQGPAQAVWSVENSRPNLDTSNHLLVGLFLNPEHKNRTVDRGPSAEDRDSATKFREFWGEKAELRRFKDGTILESLVWSRNLERDVFAQIVGFVLERHFNKEIADRVQLYEPNFEWILSTKKQGGQDPIASFNPVSKACETLETQLRALDGLPLQIRQVSLADSQLRYTSVDIPLSSESTTLMAPAAVHLQFEGSHRWPSSLQAIQRTKFAFLLKVADLLEESVPSISAKVGIEDSKTDISNSGFLEIHYNTGATFHVRIHHEHELFLLEQILKAAPHSKLSKEVAASALSNYKRTFLRSPLHTQAVRTLVPRFPLLSPAVRLLKIWRNAHLLSDHISDELIELLMIRTFVDPSPWAESGSLQTAFLRALDFIAKWHWQTEPLIVDFKGEMKSTEIESIKTRFEAWRNIDPAMNRLALFAASNFDHDGTTWTEAGPSKVVAARFQALAQAACTLVGKQGLDIQAESLFTPSLSDYDFVIHMNQSLIETTSRAQAAKQTQPYKNLASSPLPFDDSVRDFKPARAFADELKQLYGNYVLFFYDEQDMSRIAGLWNPQTNSRPWKIHVGYSTMPLKEGSATDDGQLQINKKGTLSDIARLGGDLISRIEVSGSL